MNSNQPPATPGEGPPEPRTGLTAVFRRLSDRPTPAAPQVSPAPARVAAPLPPPETPRQVPPEPPPEPARIDPRVSFAAAVLARAGAAIAARAAREAETAAGAAPPPTTSPPTPNPEVPTRSETPEAVAESPPADPAPQPPEPVAVAPAQPAAATERVAAVEPQAEPTAEARGAAEFHPQPQAEPEPEPAPPLATAIAAAPEPPSALLQSPPADRGPPPPATRPRTAPAPAYVPAWLVAPVLRIAMPDSPFGRGCAGRAIGEEGATPPPASADMIGFAEPERRHPSQPLLSESVELVFAAVGEPGAVSQQTPPLLGETAETSGVQVPPAMNGEAEPATETLPTVPSPPAEIAGSEPVAEPPTGISEARAPSITEAGEAEPATETIPVFPSVGAEIVDPEPVAGPPPATPGPSEPEIDVAEDRPDTPEPPRAARPLGAPQSGSRGMVPAPEAEPAGLPAVEVPPLVEPEIGSADPTDTAVGPPRDDRPTMRNRRLYRRVALEADFEIGGAAAKLLDLSMGGFAAANAPALAPNAVVPVTVRLAIDGVDISTRMRARMVYAETPRSGGRFIDLTAGQTAFLRYVVTWRGQSAGALGTATLLEAIGRTPDLYRPAEAAALEPPGRAEGRARWWTRMFGWFRARGAPE